MAKREVYVVHEGTDTIVALKECKIVVINDDNEEGKSMVYNDYVEGVIEHANAIYYPSEVIEALDI